MIHPFRAGSRQLGVAQLPAGTASGDLLHGGTSGPNNNTHDGVGIGVHSVDTVLTGATPTGIFNGALSDLRLFDQALGKAELQALAGALGQR